MTNQELKSILNQCELVGSFEGGGDSGQVYIKLESDSIDKDKLSQVEDKLYDMCHKTLGYDSWAGEFWAQGEITYDKGTEEIYITGLDEDHENHLNVANGDIIVKIPLKDWLNISELNLEIDREDCYIHLQLQNGVFKNNRESLAGKLNRLFSKEIDAFYEENREEEGDFNEYSDITYNHSELGNSIDENYKPIIDKNEVLIKVPVSISRYRVTDINHAINLN